MFFKAVGRVAFTTAEFLVRGKILNKKEGARLLKSHETQGFLSSKGSGLLLDGVNKKLSVKESYQNLCLSARVGAGKTSRYIIPNVLNQAECNSSMVVNDPKGEVYKYCAGWLEFNGFNVVVFDPENVDKSNLFNPLLEAKNTIELEQIAETLISIGSPNSKDPHWNNSAIRLITVLLKCLSFGEKKYFNLPNLVLLLENFGSKGSGINKWVGANCWDPDPRYNNDPSILNTWKGVISIPEKELGSIISSCLTALKAISNREVKTFLSDSDYDLSRLRREKTALFIITPPQHAQYYSFIVSLFFKSVFNECMRNEYLEGEDLPCYIFYDEFGNSHINDFVSIANTMRGYGVSLSIILQSISQLEAKYGRATAHAIQGGFNNNMCLSGSDPETIEFFSRLSGRVVETQIRRMEDTNTDRKEYNLLNSNEVRTIGENEALVISKNRQPFKINTTPYFKNRKFKKAVKFPKERKEFINRNHSISMINLESFQDQS